MSFPRATEMFQFTRFASHTYVFSMRYPEGWVSPFRNLRIKANLPAPRSLSQAITSFVAYHCQGIHHMLLVTWPYNFDASFEIKNCFQGLIWQVSHLSRYAVMWINFDISIERIIRHYWISKCLSTQLNIRFDAIKNVTSGTVCTKPLRMCSFR